MRKLLCVLSLFVMVSCNKTARNELAISVASPANEAGSNIDVALPSPEEITSGTAPDRKLVRNGSMSFEVADVNDARRKILELSNELGGYISSEKQGRIDDDRRLETVARIPGHQFDAFMAGVEGLASDINEKDVSVVDVTEEYVDLQSRLVAKKEVELRFREIVKQAKTIVDILDVENEIGTVRTDIERIEGKLKYLSNKISFSTITLAYYENSPVAVPGAGSKFAESFFIGWDVLVAFLIGLTTTWPFLIILGTIVWLIVRRRRKESAHVAATQ